MNDSQEFVFGAFFGPPRYLQWCAKHNEGTRDRLKHQATFDGVVRIQKFEPPHLTSVLSSYEFARAAAATSAFLSSPRTNSRVPLPRRLPRARPALPAPYESGDPRRASLPRTNNKKGDEINRPTPHYQAQLRAAKNRRRIFLNEFPKAGRDQPAVRRPPIERLPYARLVFRRFRVTTACAPKLKKHIF